MIEHWWNRHYHLVYIFLGVSQIPFVIHSLASGSDDGMFNVAVIAAMGAAYEFVHKLQMNRRSKVAEVTLILRQARFHNNEDMEKLAMQLLAIWGSDGSLKDDDGDTDRDAG